MVGIVCYCYSTALMLLLLLGSFHEKKNLVVRANLSGLYYFII